MEKRYGCDEEKRRLVMAIDITQYPQVLDISLERFVAQMPFFSTVANKYGPEIAGKKSGDKVLITLDPKYRSYSGFGFSPQTIVEETAEIKVDTERTVAIDLSVLDLTLNYDDTERQINNMANRLGADVENSLNDQYVNVSNYVGTAGTLPSTFENFMEPITELTRTGIMPQDLVYFIGPDEKTALLSLTKGLNNGKLVDEAIRSYFIDEFGGVDVVENLFRKTHTAGTADANYTANGASQGGNGNVVVQTGTGTLTVGDIVTFATPNKWIYAINQSRNALKTHVVDTAYTGGAGTISLKENLVAASTNAFRNVDALIANTDAMVLKATHKVGLCFQKKRAFGAAIVPLATFKSAPLRVTRSYKGVSMTLHTATNFEQESEGSKLMVLYGTATTDPDAACRAGG
jgi:hypothetical protein